MALKYYVYQLINPRNNEIIYIGKGQGNRMYYHEQVIRNGDLLSNEKLDNKIRLLINEDIKIEYKKIYETDDEKEAYKQEEQEIKKIGLNNLCNLTDRNWPPIITEETKKKISMANNGRFASEEIKRKISESLKGRKRSKEQIKKWKKSMKGYKHSEETKKKISEVLKGRLLSEEHKRNISRIRKGKISPMKGKHHSEETKKKLSKINKGKMIGEKNSFYGKHHLEETKRKLGEFYRGKSYEEIFGSKEKAEEIKQKISKGNKGKIISLKTKKKISKTLKGHLVSEETRKKISDSLKKRKRVFKRVKEEDYGII